MLLSCVLTYKKPGWWKRQNSEKKKKVLDVLQKNSVYRSSDVYIVAKSVLCF